MSLLILLAPTRPRAAAAEDDAPALAPGLDWSWVLTSDERRIERSGRSPAPLWPAASRVAVVLPAADVGWQQVTLPRGAAGRQRPALVGLLEERVLADPERCHFALPPAEARRGEAADALTWVAVVDRPWLQAVLAMVESAGRLVERVVPAFAPTAGPDLAARLHVHGAAGLGTSGADDGDGAWVTRADHRGVVVLPLVVLPLGVLPLGAVATESDGAAPASAARLTSEPATAAAAERWHGQAVTLASADDLLLEAAASPWNLRQFDLVPPRRGWRAVRSALQGLSAPAWKPARWGLVALVAAQLVGLNAWAWQQERQVRAQRQALGTLLQQTHPQIRTVVDAPLQMQRETERLRQAAGQPGEGDLEPLLAAVASAWPDGLPPAQALRYEPGRVSLMLPGVDEAALAPLRERLRPLGVATEWRDSRLVVSREGAR